MDSHPPSTDLNMAAPAGSTAPAANTTPSLPAVENHPPYPEMIMDAITSLNERDGSSESAISNYIALHHSNLPSTYLSLLTTHLKQLRDDGQILMVKNSYKLARSPLAPSVSVDGADSVGKKKRPGRPPKRKSVQDAVPVFGELSMTEKPAPDITSQMQNAATGPLGSVNGATGTVCEPVVGGTPRGRGRPPKQGVVKRGRGRPIISGGVHSNVGRSKGRPKKNAAASVVSETGRGRGRPRKVANVEGGAAVDGGSVGSMEVVVGTGSASIVPDGGLPQVPGKRRGRPPNSGSEVKKPRKVATGGESIVAGGELSQVAGKSRGRPPKESGTGSEVKKPRKLGGKPRGRPKKSAPTTGSQTPVNPQQNACLELKGKLQYFQSRIKQTVSIIKPHLSSETASTALQELETLAEMDVNTPLSIPPQS